MGSGSSSKKEKDEQTIRDQQAKIQELEQQLREESAARKRYEATAEDLESKLNTAEDELRQATAVKEVLQQHVQETKTEGNIPRRPISRRDAPAPDGTCWWVYIVGEWNTTYYKLGSAFDIKERIGPMQNSNPRQIVLKAFAKFDSKMAAEAAEKRILQVFAKQRLKIGPKEWVKDKGSAPKEWFDFPDGDGIGQNEWMYATFDAICGSNEFRGKVY